MRKTLLISLLSLCLLSSTFAEGGDQKNTRQEYIERWRVTAIEHMFEHNIPASITLAQGMLESGNGNSTLTRKANNHFGIKCHGWDGPGYYMDDDAKDECFRVYKNAEQSFEDHSQFLKKRRYEDLFKLKPTDYKGWAKGLKRAGYATHPEYAHRLIKLIEENKLYEYDRYSEKDLMALKKKSNYSAPEEEELIFASTTSAVSKKSTKKLSGSNEIVIGIGRQTMLHENNIQYVQAKKGDTYESIAKDLNLGRWQILKYNDLSKSDKIEDGDLIFIQPKHSKGKRKYHVAESGDTYWSVSQEHGIKLKKLLKRNGETSDKALKAGTKVALR